MDVHWTEVVIGVLLAIIGFLSVRWIGGIDEKTKQIDEVDKKLIKLADSVENLHSEVRSVKSAIYSRFKN